MVEILQQVASHLEEELTRELRWGSKYLLANHLLQEHRLVLIQQELNQIAVRVQIKIILHIHII